VGVGSARKDEMATRLNPKICRADCRMWNGRTSINAAIFAVLLTTSRRHLQAAPATAVLISRNWKEF
jgi:hypothetical protein